MGTLKCVSETATKSLFSNKFATSNVKSLLLTPFRFQKHDDTSILYLPEQVFITKNVFIDNIPIDNQFTFFNFYAVFRRVGVQRGGGGGGLPDDYRDSRKLFEHCLIG